jgi:hypothetical protein
MEQITCELLTQGEVQGYKHYVHISMFFLFQKHCFFFKIAACISNCVLDVNKL